MKKKSLIVLAVVLVLAICIGAWFYGYYNHKSNDNLPPLTAISEMSEADVNSLLSGYKIIQLKEVWGAPDDDKDGTAIWEIDDVKLIVAPKSAEISTGFIKRIVSIFQHF